MSDKKEDQNDSKAEDAKEEDGDGVEISEDPCHIDLTEDLYCGTNHEDIV